MFVHNVEAKGTVSEFTNLKVTIVSRFWVEKLESNANLSHLNKKTHIITQLSVNFCYKVITITEFSATVITLNRFCYY